MKKNCHKICLWILIPFLLIVAIFIGGVYYFFYDMGRLPQGELIEEVVSPNGDYTMKAYLCNGGATVSYAVRGELNYNQKNKKAKNIYWDYRIEDADIEWTDEDTVVINGHSIDVLKETYDWRR